jgi:predicted deacylase
MGSTHGDEPEGPYSIALLTKQPELDPKKMAGTLVLVPALNVEALMDGQRGDPRDAFSYDMNRFYPGKPDGYPSERVAWAYMESHRNIAVFSGVSFLVVTFRASVVLFFKR